MKPLKMLGFLFCSLLLTSFVSAQSTSFDYTKLVEETPAFAVLALHRSAVSNELNKLQSRLTAAHPIVVSKRLELEITQREMAKILITPKSQESLLNNTYGRLVVRKITTEAALLDLLRRNTLNTHQVRNEANKLRAIENELIEVLSR